MKIAVYLLNLTLYKNVSEKKVLGFKNKKRILIFIFLLNKITLMVCLKYTNNSPALVNFYGTVDDLIVSIDF